MDGGQGEVRDLSRHSWCGLGGATHGDLIRSWAFNIIFCEFIISVSTYYIPLNIKT